jgi:type II secretory pathway pseudopilin PulG
MSAPDHDRVQFARDQTDRDQPGRRPRVKNIITGLLLVALMVLIAGMVLPALTMDMDRGRRHVSCANNQRQIVLSAMVYANDNDQLWPVRPTDAYGRATTDPTAIDGFCTAAASLEFLMVRNSADMALKLFVCPQNTSTQEYLTNPTEGSKIIDYASGESHWGNNHLAETPGGPGAMAYAYDWSAPTNTSAIRVVITDRGNLTVAHKKVIMGAAADGHVVTINMTAENWQRSPGTHVTMDLNGGNETASFSAKDSSNGNNDQDDVYDDRGDDLNMNKPACGSATRCWVR